MLDGYGGFHYEIQGGSLQNACSSPAKETSGNKTSSYPYIPMPSISLHSHLWSLGGVDPWECNGFPKPVPLVVLGLFVEKHKDTEKF